MVAELDIVNFGLVEAGGVQIASMQQNIKSAGVASLLYTQMRDAKMTENRWNFTIQRKALPAVATPPAFGFNYQYTYPADMLTVIELSGYSIGSPSLGAIYNDEVTEPYLIENNMILTDFPPPLKIRAAFRVPNPNLWHPMFIEVMRWSLAEIFVSPLANRATERKTYYAGKARDTVGRAIECNAIELPPEETDDGSWVLSRIGP